MGLTKTNISILDHISKTVKVESAEPGSVCVDCGYAAQWRVTLAGMTVDDYCQHHYVGMIHQYDRYMWGVNHV